IGWTGQWKAETCKEVNGPLWIRAGLQKLNLSLEPGETIRSPRILQVYWEGQGNDMQGCNDFRRTMIAHIMPKIDGKTIVPPITHMSCCFSIPDDTATEADIVSFIEPMKEAGFEYLWHDAFYAPKKFPLVGDYSLPLPRSFDPVRFPEGFANIARKTEEAGLKYLQWYEPERICPGSIVATEHPEWTVIPPNQPWGGIDLGNPDAWRFVYEFLAEHVRVYGIDALRIDNAVSYSALWGELDSRNGENRVGIAEIRYVEGLYRLWDTLLAEFPGLFFDNCASGGMRIDLEMCARSIPLWRTDATIGPLLAGDFEKAAECNQIISSGLNRYLPVSTSGQRGCSPYCFRSGFNGGIVFADDIRKSDYPMEELKAAIREGKRIRKYFYGDYYLLTPPSTSSEDWCIMQYDRPEEKDGLVMLFRRGKSPYSSVSLFRMENIDPDANYEITVSRTYTPEPPRILKGSEFKEEVFQMPGHPESMIIEYKKL
ncbi:MAG: alpha-galactosidase, partial [Thermoguttaceae bacterium]|nr:alpha-galactosidase [Thermoguttaceae bacterium]